MPIIYNGVTLTDINYNGVSLDKVIYNGVTVFEKVPSGTREPASGEYYNFTVPYTGIYNFWEIRPNSLWIYFNSTTLPNGGNIPHGTTPVNALSFVYDGWTYYRGTLMYSYYNAGQRYAYGIYRIKN